MRWLKNCGCSNLYVGTVDDSGRIIKTVALQPGEGVEIFGIEVTWTDDEREPLPKGRVREEEEL